MDHDQKRHEKHEQERKVKQSHERQSEANFSKPGPTVRPLWFGVIGVILALVALAVWMTYWW